MPLPLVFFDNSTICDIICILGQVRALEELAKTDQINFWGTFTNKETNIKKTLTGDHTLVDPRL